MLKFAWENLKNKLIMCCVEEIKDTIIAAQEEFDNNSKFINQEQAINQYLDIIIDIRKNLCDLNKVILELYDILHSNFTELTTDDYDQISGMYKNLVRNLIKLYATYRKSEFFSGIKTDLMNLKSNIQNLEEMSNDIEVFIVELGRNNEYKALADRISIL